MSEAELLWTKTIKQAPFDKNGNLLGYDDHWRSEIRDVTEPFWASLVYSGYGRGRSSIVFKWKDIPNSCGYEMFVSDFNDLVMLDKFTCRAVHGWWQVVKKGANYGIKYIGETK